MESQKNPDIKLDESWGFDSRGYNVLLNGRGNSATGANTYKEGDSVTLYAGDNPYGDFTGWTVNGIAVQSTVTDMSARTISFTMPANEVVVKANWTLATTPMNDPTITAGGQNQYRAGSSSSYDMTIDVDFDTLYAATANDKDIMQYASPGSIKISIPASELGSLKQGDKIDIRLDTTQGYYTKSVSVVGATSPATGDTSVEIPWSWITLGIITVAGVAFAVVLKRRVNG